MTILCNNAGANFRVSFDDQTEEMWHTVMNIGLTGAFLVIKAAVSAMRRAGGGAIVNMESRVHSFWRREPGLRGQHGGNSRADDPVGGQTLRIGRHPMQHVLPRPRRHAFHPPRQRPQPQRLAPHYRQPGQLPAQTRRHPAGPPPNPRGHRQSVLVPGVRRRFDDYQGEPEGGRRRWHLEK